MNKFIIKRKDGGISIGIHIEGDNLDDEIMKWEQTYPCKSSYHQYENRFPNDEDGYFHEAYDHSQEQGVFVDMEKAKVLHINKLREIRKQKFIDLGFPHKLNPQLEDAILDESIKSKLKELRDFPQNLDLSNVNDHNELKNIIPLCLINNHTI